MISLGVCWHVFAGDLLRRLVLPDGSVLRATRPAAPAVDTLFCDVLRDRRTLLKVGLRCLRDCRDCAVPCIVCVWHSAL